MKRLIVALVAVLTALGLSASVSARSSATKLNGTVGPGFTIVLKKGTARVSKLKAGQYVIVINDRSGSHNFHLKGPGVNKMTTVPGRGVQKPWVVTLRKGKYTYVCDPHAFGLKGSFTVT
ncbi:MAG: plastocyanin/azurin family copper-binding protein [Actinomycetota bacterium]|nr:plastocyanin/azurin family copper-binding protein [Actinomycetota bacterium]